MKTIMLFLFILPIIRVNGQDFIIEMKSELSWTQLKFDYDKTLNIELKKRTRDLNFSVGISGRIHEWLYLKSTIGVAHLDNSAYHIKWKAKPIYSDDILEHDLTTIISASQVFMEIMPEVRLANGWFYLNSGGGVNKQYDHTPTFIYFTVGDKRWDSYEPYNGVNPYVAANIGTNLHFRNIGLMIEYGIRRSGFIGPSGEPGMGFNQYSLKAGICYMFGRITKDELRITN